MKSVSFYPFTAQEVFMAKRKTPNHFLLRKVPKKKLNLKIVKVSRKKTEMRPKMNTIDFINIIGQQSFLENSINPIEIKIENNTVKNMI